MSTTMNMVLMIRRCENKSGVSVPVLFVELKRPSESVSVEYPSHTDRASLVRCHTLLLSEL